MFFSPLKKKNLSPQTRPLETATLRGEKRARTWRVSRRRRTDEGRTVLLVRVRPLPAVLSRVSRAARRSRLSAVARSSLSALPRLVAFSLDRETERLKWLPPPTAFAFRVLTRVTRVSGVSDLGTMESRDATRRRAAHDAPHRTLSRAQTPVYTHSQTPPRPLPRIEYSWLDAGGCGGAATFLRRRGVARRPNDRPRFAILVGV